MSIFENPFHKKTAPSEQKDPPPLRTTEAPSIEGGRVEPSLARGPEEANDNHLPEDAFAAGPETLEQEAERRFNQMATELNMSPDDLRSLDRYEIPGAADADHNIPFYGIRGHINGLDVDVHQERATATGQSEFVAAVGDRTIGGHEAGEEFSRLDKALSRRGQWKSAYEAFKDKRALSQVRGEN